jgi:hypothetical protein
MGKDTARSGFTVTWIGAALAAAGLNGACDACSPAARGTAAAEPAAVASGAPISGFARGYVTGDPIPEATITVLETGRTLKTDRDGKYAFHHPVGARLTLQLTKLGFEPVQTDTVVVPASGLTGPHDNIALQALLKLEYELFQAAIGMRPDPRMCHVATTIAAAGKTVYDHFQGEPGARLVLDPEAPTPAFYFAAFGDKGPLAYQSNPFVRTLEATSQDGGAAVFNLPPRDELYTLTAVKPGVRFSEAKIWCRPGSFINVSPPRGPTVIP